MSLVVVIPWYWWWWCYNWCLLQRYGCGCGGDYRQSRCHLQRCPCSWSADRLSSSCAHQTSDMENVENRQMLKSSRENIVRNVRAVQQGSKLFILILYMSYMQGTWPNVSRDFKSCQLPYFSNILSKLCTIFQKLSYLKFRAGIFLGRRSADFFFLNILHRTNIWQGVAKYS